MKNARLFSIVLLFLSVQTAIAQHTVLNDRPAENIPSSTALVSTCDTIFSFSHLGLNPTGIAFDGTRLWCNGNFNSKSIFRFDLAGQLLDSIPSVGSITFSGDMEFDGTHILVCIEQDGILYKLDPITGAVVSQFNLPLKGNPADRNNYGIAFDGTYLWHTEYRVPSSHQTILYKLDATSIVVLDSFVLPSVVLSIGFINGSLYGLAPMAGMLHKIDLTNGKYLFSEPWCAGYPLGITFANNHIWASDNVEAFNGTGRVFQFDVQFLSNTYSNSQNISYTLYPNPASDRLHIRLQETYLSNVRVEIGNLLDQHIHVLIEEQQVFPDHQFDVDLSRLPAGVYTVKVQSGTAQSLKILIKM